MLSKKRNGWLWVVMLFAVCAVVYGMLSSYPRELAVYSDELRYLDVARSLLQGRGLRVRNMPSDYQKILYPLCILPALLLKTTAAQITAIGWLNAVYMASAVFPAYALARAMGMNRRRTAFLVGVTAVLPTMSAASTFMSETVFLPLSLWQVYFFLRAMLAEPKARVGWCAAAGAFCYLLYLNKEVALYYLIAWVLVRTWVWWHDKASWRAELKCRAAGQLSGLLSAGQGDAVPRAGQLLQPDRLADGGAVALSAVCAGVRRAVCRAGVLGVPGAAAALRAAPSA